MLDSLLPPFHIIVLAMHALNASRDTDVSGLLDAVIATPYTKLQKDHSLVSKAIAHLRKAFCKRDSTRRKPRRKQQTSLDIVQISTEKPQNPPDEPRSSATDSQSPPDASQTSLDEAQSSLDECQSSSVGPDSSRANSNGPETVHATKLPAGALRLLAALADKLPTIEENISKGLALCIRADFPAHGADPIRDDIFCATPGQTLGSSFRHVFACFEVEAEFREWYMVMKSKDLTAFARTQYPYDQSTYKRGILYG